MATLQIQLGRLRASRNPRLLMRYLREFRQSVEAIEKTIDETGADVVVIGGLVNPHAAFAARRSGAAVLWLIVDSRSPSVLRRLAMLFVGRLADAVTFAGSALVGLHGGRERLSMPLFVSIPPVDTARFVPSPERGLETRAQLGVPARAPVVGTVATFSPMKGLEHFLAAARLIALQRPDAHFVVVGSAPVSHGDYAERLRRQAEELGLPHPVVFAGERADVERWYPAFDVHVITSLPRSEGTTTTAMEAEACGVPVVATRVCAIPEVVDDAVTGILVEPERPDLIAAAVLKLLDDDSLRSRMGAAGREAAVGRFGLEAAADRQVLTYEAALAHARSHTSGRHVPDRTA